MTAPITLFTGNVKLLPKGFGGSKADDRRIAKFADYLLDRAPDVVCLQEVFSEDGRAVLKKKLRKCYPFMVAKSSDNDFLQEDSGLFFASRLPLQNHRFVEFDAAASSDQLADKGVLGTILKLPGKRQLLVFNTHMQSSEAYADVRRKQLQQMRRFMQKSFRARLAKKPKKIPDVALLLVGDLNVIAERPLGDQHQPTAEYTRAISLLGYPRDLYRECNPKQAGYTWDGPGNKLAGDKDRQRLDYTLAFDHLPEPDDNAPPVPLARVDDVEVEIVDKLPDGSFFSDHYALLATFAVA